MRFTGEHNFTGKTNHKELYANKASIKENLNIPLSSNPDNNYGDIFCTSNKLYLVDRKNIIHELLPISDVENIKQFIYNIINNTYENSLKQITLNEIVNIDFTVNDFTAITDNEFYLILQNDFEASELYNLLSFQISRTNGIISFNTINVKLLEVYLNGNIVDVIFERFDTTTSINAPLIISNLKLNSITKIFTNNDYISILSQYDESIEKKYILSTNRHIHTDSEILLNKNSPHGYLYLNESSEVDANVNFIGDFKVKDFKFSFNLNDVDDFDFRYRIDKLQEEIYQDSNNNVEYFVFSTVLNYDIRVGNFIKTIAYELFDYTATTIFEIYNILEFDISNNEIRIYPVFDYTNNVYDVDFNNNIVRILLNKLSIRPEEYTSSTPDLVNLKYENTSYYLFTTVDQQRNISIPKIFSINEFEPVNIILNSDAILFMNTDMTNITLFDIYSVDLMFNETVFTAYSLGENYIMIYEAGKYKLQISGVENLKICIIY